MPITDLTGYTWVGNNNISHSDYYNRFLSYYLNFNIDNNSYSIFAFSFDNKVDYSFISLYYDDGFITPVYTIGVGWQNQTYKTIQITGGTDATNSTLIAWLEANGTLTAPIQANTYTLTHTLTNLTKGNITLQITPDTNYTYPTSLTISNGTIVSYDNTTGVAVISGNDTTIVDGECVEEASILPPIISLQNNNEEFVITPQNIGEEQYEIYANGTDLGTFNQGYTFLADGNTINKCLGRQYYTGIITTPTSINGTNITSVSGPSSIDADRVFTGCVASKIVFSEGITNIHTNAFDSTTQTINIVLPSTLGTAICLTSYPHNLIIGQTGYVEYNWENALPANAFQIAKGLSAAATFVYDIKSTITSIGNSAFAMTITGKYSATYNMYFRQPSGIEVSFGTSIITAGSQKTARTYNVYTDNESVKTTMESYAAQYTTINVYKLDGSNWGE